MPHATALLDRGLRGQPGPVQEPLAGVGIHGEVSDLKSGEVLEEVAALRGRNAKVAKARLHDYARSGNLVPGHRYAEPRVGRSPASHADEEVGLVVLGQLCVDARHRLGHLAAARAVEAM